MTKTDAIKLCVFLVLLIGNTAYWGVGLGGGVRGWLNRRRIRRQLREKAGQSFTVDVCEPGNMLVGDGTRFGTMTFRDGTEIRGTL